MAEKFPYTKDNQTVLLRDFQAFTVHDQKDLSGNDDKAVSNFIRDFIQDPQRDIQEPFFTISEVI